MEKVEPDYVAPVPRLQFHMRSVFCFFFKIMINIFPSLLKAVENLQYLIQYDFLMIVIKS